MTTLLQDLRHAALVTLALAIGANTAVFSVVATSPNGRRRRSGHASAKVNPVSSVRSVTAHGHRLFSADGPIVDAHGPIISQSKRSLPAGLAVI